MRKALLTSQTSAVVMAMALSSIAARTGLSEINTGPDTHMMTAKEAEMRDEANRELLRGEGIRDQKSTINAMVDLFGVDPFHGYPAKRTKKGKGKPRGRL